MIWPNPSMNEIEVTRRKKYYKLFNMKVILISSWILMPHRELSVVRFRWLFFFMLSSFFHSQSIQLHTHMYRMIILLVVASQTVLCSAGTALPHHIKPCECDAMIAKPKPKPIPTPNHKLPQYKSTRNENQ